MTRAVADCYPPEVPYEKETPVKRDAHYPTSAVQLKLPGIATVSAPLALRKTPQNPLALPDAASVQAPGALVGSRGSIRVRGAGSGYVATLPDVAGEKFVRLDGQARLDAAAPCLARALELLKRRDGWCQGSTVDDLGRVSLNGALQLGGKTPLETYFAREVLRRVLCEHDFVAWNDHPFRRRTDVVRAVKSALVACTKHARRGGWVVSR